MPHTHSQLETFLDTCPRQYKAKYVTKEVKFEETAETRWGNYVHDQFEHHLKGNTELPQDLLQYKPMLNALVAKGGDLIVEGNIAFNEQRKETGFFAEDAYFRGKIDVDVIKSFRAVVVDWKTGKVKDDVKQLIRYALLTFAKYEFLQEVRACYGWLKAGKFSKPVVVTRDDVNRYYDQLDQDIIAVEHAREVDAFPPKPSGLCRGWCQVTSCEHWKPKRG